MSAADGLGAEFARALAGGDVGRLRELTHYRASNPDGRFLVEQQAYLAPREGRIGWMRVVCSGFRPAG